MKLVKLLWTLVAGKQKVFLMAHFYYILALRARLFKRSCLVARYWGKRRSIKRSLTKGYLSLFLYYLYFNLFYLKFLQKSSVEPFL
jgi:hypothetical protein